MHYGDTLRGGSSGGDKGRAFRTRTGTLFASAGMKGGSLGRDARGRYTTFQNELYHINLKLALELQAMMVEKLEATRVPERKGVASGRLAAALSARENRDVTNAGFGVGKVSWLDRSQAKYWRAIEVGTSQFVGNVLPVGLWGSTLSGAYGGTSRFGPYPLAGPSFSWTGNRRDGRLRPMGRTYAYRHLAESGMSKREAYLLSKKKMPTIQNPILAHRYMKGAWDDFRPAARTTAAVRQALRAAGIAGSTRGALSGG